MCPVAWLTLLRIDMYYFSTSFSSGGYGVKRFLHLLVFLPVLLLVDGCGFQLRGALDLSQDISPIYIDPKSAYELDRDIKMLLATNNIPTVDKAYKANSVLVLLKERKSNRVLSVDANGRAREYLLNYSVIFTMKVKQSIEKQDTISLTRSLVFDPDAVLAVTNETEILYKDMRQDASRSILLRLQALSRQEAKSQAETADDAQPDVTEKTQ